MQTKIAQVLQDSHKIVIKIGSNTLSHEDGTINHDFLEDLVKQLVFLRKEGKQIAIVSSGARIAGVSKTNKWKRKSDIHYKQALCAIGQVELMNSYSQHFSSHGIFIGQLLLTKEDFYVEDRSRNIRNTLFTLADEGIIPIINENDTVSVDEIKIGDNDTLSAHVATLWNAGALILLSDIDGIYDKNPKEFPEAKLVEEINDFDRDLQKIRIGASNSFGTGGILTKIEAARLANNYGIPVILANGKREDIIEQVYLGQAPATIFNPRD